MNISVVLPCYNEEANIEQAVRGVRSWLQHDDHEGEIIVVNDGSSDGTAWVLALLQESIPLLRVVEHPENRGYGAAVRSGCDEASGDVIAFMDSDGQFHAEDFGRLIPHLQEVDFVTGYRAHRADPWYRLLNAFLYKTLVRLVLGIHVRDINCAMKVFRAGIWTVIRPTVSTGALLNAEIFLRLKLAKKKWKEVSVSHYPRRAGTPTGSNPAVILRMFRELFALKRKVRRSLSPKK